MSLLRVQRQGSGPTFVWLHGFTHTRESAHVFRSILAGTSELWTVDLPGHGVADTLSATLEETADLIADVLPDRPVALGGYSLGGRVALHVALRHGERLSRLVVVGASRGIENPADRSVRRSRDEQLAIRIESIGAEAFLNEWLDQSLFSSLVDDPMERSARSTHGANSARGLAESLRRAGTGTQEWLAPRLGAIDVPTLALAGTNDAKFTVEASAIAQGVRTGTFDTVDHAGHAAHLEQPERTAERIAQFLPR